jgi:trypsin
MTRIVKDQLVLTIALIVSCGIVLADDSPGGRRIMGGTPTSIEQNLWQVALNIKASESSTYFCSGSAINKRWILTAAHCFPTLHPSDTQVQAGQTFYSPSAKRLGVEQVVPHKSYDPVTHENDIALIKLTSPYSGMSISLAGFAISLTNTRLDVTGWGATSEGGAASRRLMLATVPYVENATCNAPASYNNTIKATMLCAGAKGVDSCQGDSGGPLVLRGTDGAVLVGIVSFGEGCGKEIKYGVYTRVSSYRTWIDQIIKLN